LGVAVELGQDLAVAATASVLAILTVPPLYRTIHGLVRLTPGLRRLTPAVEDLHRDTVVLLHRLDTLGWSVISVVQAACTIGVFWLVVNGLAPGALTIWQAASVYAISNVVGALSLIPGRIGAYEASVLGLLVAIGLDPATAAAAALLHRVADKGFATVLGFITHAVVRHRLRLTSIVATQPARHIRVEGLPRDVAGWHRLGAAVEEQFRTLGGRAASPPEPWDITLACELRH
jgi:uncharacterized membrane protein YbhN (UPF0104 family)